MFASIFILSCIAGALAAPHNCSNYIVIIEDASALSSSNATIEIIELTEGSGHEGSAMGTGNQLTDSLDDESYGYLDEETTSFMRRAARALNASAENATAGNSTGNSTCDFNTVCYADEDCGEGKCLGAFVGKCNCNACLNFVSCEDDSACGGLKGACNNESRCDCIEGFKTHGFKQFTDALSKLCNHKECTRDGDECFGLPCNSGRCVCSSSA